MNKTQKLCALCALSLLWSGCQSAPKNLFSRQKPGPAPTQETVSTDDLEATETDKPAIKPVAAEKPITDNSPEETSDTQLLQTISWEEEAKKALEIPEFEPMAAPPVVTPLTDLKETLTLEQQTSLFMQMVTDLELARTFPRNAMQKDATEPVNYESDANQVELGPNEQAYPIDLYAALRLAGAENWNIRLAAERVHQARAQHEIAKVQWVPSIVAGIGYTKHEGKIQATTGEILDISRNSLFVGGGPVVGQAPLAGGSGGPARLMVDLSLADAIYDPLAARQDVRAQRYQHNVIRQNTMREVSVSYYNLSETQGRLAIANDLLDKTLDLQQTTTNFVDAGKGSRADKALLKTAVAARKQDIKRAQLDFRRTAAQLAGLIQLDPTTTLFALEDQPLQVQLVDQSQNLNYLISHAQRCRPEVGEARARYDANCQRSVQERMRPLLPNLMMGFSGGGFGGGVNDELHDLEGRADFDVAAIWQVRNLGLGERAQRNNRDSITRQATLDTWRVKDQIAVDVTQAYHAVQIQHSRIELAQNNLKEARSAYATSLERVRELVGVPLETLETLRLLAQAQNEYLNSVLAYNRAQAELLWATGQPIQ